MKKLTLILLCIVSAFVAEAQHIDVNRFAEDIGSRRVSFSISFSEQNGSVMYYGDALIQKDCYRVTVNNVSYICDGTTLWIVDRQAMEITIQDAEPLPGGITNPKQLLKRTSVTKSGKDFLNGVFSVPEDRKKYDFKMTSVKVESPSADKSAFSYDSSSAGSSWIVTDLR
ncbi:MAG: hypothetical protein MJY42_03480 [Bacteroidales bacterium]|nr:hypothetical protein [Bacteroidales bacterium]